MARFEDLNVWRRARRLSADLYKTLAFLKDFGFRDQITKSGLSIPSNIAEGYERSSKKEKNNFLAMPKVLPVNCALKSTSAWTWVT